MPHGESTTDDTQGRGARGLWSRPREVDPPPLAVGPAEPDAAADWPPPDTLEVFYDEEPEPDRAADPATGPGESDSPDGDPVATEVAGLLEGVERRLQATLSAQEERLSARLEAAERRQQDTASAVSRAVAQMSARVRELETVRLELDARARELQRQLETVRVTVDRQLPETVARQRESAATLETLLHTFQGAVNTLEDVLDQGLVSLTEWREDLPATTRRVGLELARDVDGARERLVADAGRGTAELERAARQAHGLASALARVEGVLVDRLQDWERASLHERRRAIDEIVTRLVDGLPPRQRRRIAEQLLERERAQAADPEPPRSVAELLPREAADPVLLERHGSTARTGTGSAEVPDAPSRHDPASGGQASDLDAVLTAVPGVGPARRAALLRSFDDAALRDASVEELAAVETISTPLAHRIRQALDDLEDRADRDDLEDPTEREDREG